VYYPGASGWIEKYFDLVEKDQIQLVNANDSTLIELSRNSGLLYGVAVETIFISDALQVNWTSKDKLKNLFFEALVWTHWKNSNYTFEKEAFINDLAKFYSSNKPSNSFDFLSFFKKESVISSIESAIEERLELDKRILETRIWLNTLNNAFVFLDVLVFQEYLKTGKNRPVHVLSKVVLNCFIATAHSDKDITEIEDKLFSFFLASARLEKEKEIELENNFQEANYKPNLDEISSESDEFKNYLVYFTAFVITCKTEISSEEKSYLITFCESLHISTELAEIALAFNTAFVLENSKLIPYLGTSTEILFSNLSKRWGKILLRNKDKLILEIQQSKELMFLLAKSTQKDLTKEEKELVKNQLMDIMRSMPSLAIFLIPGGTLLLPIFLKIIPGLMPSAFRDNELTKND
jgi:hypothetical protein